MKHIKPYKIFESQEESTHPSFPETEEEIHRLCNKYSITDYTINSDLSIDVDGDVYLGYKDLDYLPLKFNKVGGDFSCSSNELKSLEGSPIEVGGYFICSHNELKSLEYIPSGIDYTSDYTDFNNNPIYSVVSTFIKGDNV